MEFFSEDMNTSKMSDGCIFGGKADICKEFKCHRSSHGDAFSPALQSAVDSSIPFLKFQPTRRVDKNHSSKDNEMAATQTSSFVVSSETYKTLLENLYIARMWLLRSRNITMNQLNVYEEEAIEHMQEIKRIIREDLENPEASAESLAKELVKASTEVVQSQRDLNRIEMEELATTLDNLLNMLKSDVKEAKSLAEPKYQEKTKTTAHANFIFDYGHWRLFISIVLIMGLLRYLRVFEEYL